MGETVVDTQSMQDVLVRYIKTQRVRIREDNGVITLTPVTNREESPLRGFWGDGKLSTERFLEQKRLDKELEGI